MNAVLSCDELKAITGYQRPSDVARCLRDQGIQVFQGRHGPWTTIDLINQAGGLEHKAQHDDINPRRVL